MVAHRLWSSLLLSSVVLLTTACSAQADDFTKEEIEAIVKEYLLENPEVIADAIYRLQAKAEAEKAEQEAAALSQLTGQLTGNDVDPVGGNNEGTITLVEFFDYNCGYCKRSNDVLKALIKDNPDLRVVYKEWPILSESSGIAARIALAVSIAQPEAYEAVHRALLDQRGYRTDDDIWRIAERQGVDRALVEPALNDPRVGQHLQQTAALAQQLGITGTPAFIVGDQVFKGAYPQAQLQAAIDAQRDE